MGSLLTLQSIDLSDVGHFSLLSNHPCISSHAMKIRTKSFPLTILLENSWMQNPIQNVRTSIIVHLESRWENGDESNKARLKISNVSLLLEKVCYKGEMVLIQMYLLIAPFGCALMEIET